MLGRMTAPWAIVIAGGIIGLSVFAALVVQPYRISGGADGTWRINTITGEVQTCSIAFGGCRSPVFH